MKFNGINHLAMATGDMDAIISRHLELYLSLSIIYQAIEKTEKSFSINSCRCRFRSV